MLNTLGNCQGRRPLGSQDVKANGSVAVDIRMVYSCCECYLWWFEWVICWKVDGQKKDSSLVWTVWLQKATKNKKKRGKFHIRPKVILSISFVGSFNLLVPLWSLAIETLHGRNKKTNRIS